MTFKTRAACSATFICACLAGANSAPSQQLGRISFSVSATPSAQNEFVRGVLFLHSFEYTLAADAFRRAQIIEPDFAMEYWGEALTYTHQVWNEQDAASARAARVRICDVRLRICSCETW